MHVVQVLVVADFQIRVSVWDLKGQNCRHRSGPKFSECAMVYSKDGRHLAVAEVHHPLVYRLSSSI